MGEELLLVEPAQLVGQHCLDLGLSMRPQPVAHLRGVDDEPECRSSRAFIRPCGLHARGLVEEKAQGEHLDLNLSEHRLSGGHLLERMLVSYDRNSDNRKAGEWDHRTVALNIPVELTFIVCAS